MVEQEDDAEDESPNAGPYHVFSVQICGEQVNWADAELTDLEQRTLLALDRHAHVAPDDWSPPLLDFATSVPAFACTTTVSSSINHGYSVNTKYKPKGVKVEPVDAQLPDKYCTKYKVCGYLRDPYLTPLTAPPPKVHPYRATQRGERRQDGWPTRMAQF